jgi:hypothetical protein
MAGFDRRATPRQSGSEIRAAIPFRPSGEPARSHVLLGDVILILVGTVLITLGSLAAIAHLATERTFAAPKTLSGGFIGPGRHADYGDSVGTEQEQRSAHGIIIIRFERGSTDYVTLQDLGQTFAPMLTRGFGDFFTLPSVQVSRSPDG